MLMPEEPRRPRVWSRPEPLPVSYAVQHERSSPRFAGAFAAGCGGQATPLNVRVPDAPMALFGSPERWDLLQEHIATGQDWYYADHAYFRRGRQYRIARNRYQSAIDVTQLPQRMPSRFAALRLEPVQAWQENGSAIVICPNSPTYMAWFGIDAKRWTLDVAEEISRYTDRPIIIRWKSNAQQRPLYLDLHNAYATVVFSSGAAVESLYHGVPVFVLASWATTAPMGLNNLSKINQPYRPDHRLPFLWELAERQWNLDEIQAGVAWRWFLSREEEQI